LVKNTIFKDVEVDNYKTKSKIMQKAENNFTVVCFGMSQQGKSSFINEVAG